ncbi:60S ribosomal protein L14 [Gryllus bimaculatus]|nr:60S ribosomal protein L14 [Gryllus bimaculatus]
MLTSSTMKLDTMGQIIEVKYVQSSILHQICITTKGCDLSSSLSFSSGIGSLSVDTKMSFKRFVEAGRIAFIVNGPKKGKLCTIVDVIDQTRVLVDGPLTGVERQAVRINQINLTKFCLKFPRGCRTATVRKAWKDAKIQEQWEKSSWAKSLVNKRKRLAMTDFDRFKLRKAVSVRNRIRSNEFFVLRKFAYRKHALYGMKKAKKTEQMRESAKKKAIARAKARAVIKARWAAKGITAVFKRTLARPALFPPMQKKPSDSASKPTGKTPQKPKEKAAAKK